MTTLPADVSATQLADILGIGRRAVADLDKAGTLAKNGAGRFPLAPAIAAYIASRLAAARRDPGDTFKDQYAAERARKLRIENDLRDHKLVQIEDVEAAVDWVCGEVRNEMYSVAARVSGDMIERRAIEDALRHAANCVAEAMGARAEAERAGTGASVGSTAGPEPTE